MSSLFKLLTIKPFWSFKQTLLQYQLTSGSFKIVRTTASYFFSPSGHGKWAKTVLFRIFANYSNAKFSGDIRGCHTQLFKNSLCGGLSIIILILFKTQILPGSWGNVEFLEQDKSLMIVLRGRNVCVCVKRTKM